MPERGPRVLGGDRLREDRSVGHLAGERQGLGAPDARQDVGHDVGQCAGVELYAVEVHVLPAPLREFAAQQCPQGVDVLAEEGERARGPLADAAHPGGHAMSHGDVDAAGEELCQGRDLQRRERHVAGPGGQQSDADPDAVGGRQHCGSLGDTPAESEVLDHPQGAKSQLLGPSRVRQDPVGGQVARQQNAYGPVGGGGMHRCSPSVGGRATAIRAPAAPFRC